jgi:hypothetical protein
MIRARRANREPIAFAGANVDERKISLNKIGPRLLSCYFMLWIVEARCLSLSLDSFGSIAID